MHINRKTVLGFTGLLLLLTIACSFSASTANIKEAFIAQEVDGEMIPTTTFAPDDTFYCIVSVANAPDDTVTKAVWYAIDAEGLEPNFQILEYEYVGGGLITFELSNDEYDWPICNYKVEIYLDGELDQTLEFSVEASI
jgi:hypothetical protein